jgi:hypothetical protein
LGILKSWTPALPLLCAVAGLTSACKPSAPTYYQDVQPIIQAKCEGCHNPAGIGPFSFESPSDVTSRATLIRGEVTSKKMPPWPPSESCNQYAQDRSLSDAEINTLTSWMDSGMQLGDVKTQKTGKANQGMSRIDQTIQMPQPFTPIESPDDYRCFLLDWTPATSIYVTGFGVRPGSPQIVHHAISYIATPDTVASYEAMDGADGHPGWTCFGGPNGNGGLGGLDAAPWLGAWAPGSLGNDFPADSGVQLAAGTRLILQVHYNTSVNAPVPDQSTVYLETANSVKKPAAVLPFVDPDWLNGSMTIPANSPDTMHNYSMDPTPYMSILTNGVLTDLTGFTIYMSFLHMHTRGSSILGQVVHADGSKQCLLDVPQWSFNWQGGYTFSQPVPFVPGDQLYLECHWNNTAANQPVVDGVQEPPHDLNWGETTEDEMCLEILYLTQ